MALSFILGGGNKTLFIESKSGERIGIFEERKMKITLRLEENE